MTTPVQPSPPKQLSLGVQLNDDATFDNFYVCAGETNAQAVAVLKSQLQPLGEQCVFVWGGTGVGLTHLLQAACHQADQQGAGAQYLPLQDLAGFAPSSLLEGLESLDLVCLDGLQAVAGLPGWERALFHFFNAMRDSGRCLVMAADASPRELAVTLPDLQSRLTWGLVFQVLPLTDEAKQSALQMRARARGLELADDVAQFILHRAPRDMNKLFDTLRRLDDASLAQQRRLTIPFVKQTLGL